MNDNNDFNKNTEDYTKKISFQDGGTVSDEVRYNLNESGNDDETLDFDQRRLEYDPETEEEYRKSRKPHKGECEKKKSSFKISIIAIITMFILALGIVSSYPYIKNIVNIEDNKKYQAVGALGFDAKNSVAVKGYNDTVSKI